MKRILTAVLAVIIILTLVTGCARKAPSGEALKLTDAKGNVLIETHQPTALFKQDNWAYLDAATVEAAQLLATQKGISDEDALQALFSDGYTVTTAYVQAVFDAVRTGVADHKAKAVACAVTDLAGNLLALYSSGDGSTNHATAPTSPYSAFKPLSVYTPAVEAGLIDWSTTYEDGPYKLLKDSDGVEREWPSNSTGKYSRQEVNISRAIRESLNTVAVKCLSAYGVEKSLAFLRSSFGMELVEADAAEQYGPEEVIGNVALGYLERGVSPADMAGYYQIFANGGSYSPAKTVLEIRDSAGTVIYTRQDSARQVVSPGTADLMNKLLQQVVSGQGTGREAACGGIPVAGKTGTGDQNDGNWFVGVTPAYSCAVWHGESEKNQADALFSQVIRGVYEALPNSGRLFITHKNLQQIIYCTESGKAICPDCTNIDMGWFAMDTVLPVCDAHKQDRP